MIEYIHDSETLLVLFRKGLINTLYVRPNTQGSGPLAVALRLISANMDIQAMSAVPLKAEVVTEVAAFMDGCCGIIVEADTKQDYSVLDKVDREFIQSIVADVEKGNGNSGGWHWLSVIAPKGLTNTVKGWKEFFSEEVRRLNELEASEVRAMTHVEIEAVMVRGGVFGLVTQHSDEALHVAMYRAISKMEERADKILMSEDAWDSVIDGDFEIMNFLDRCYSAKLIRTGYYGRYLGAHITLTKSLQPKTMMMIRGDDHVVLRIK